MVRLIGVDLPSEKRVKYALTSIYGIGLARAQEIITKAGLDHFNNEGVRVKNLSDDDVSNLRRVIERDYRLESDLLRLNQLNLKRLMDNGCIRGRRHRVGLPVRGQRTRTNARTKRKGVKSTIGNRK